MRSLFFLAAGMFTMGCDDYVVAGLLPGIGATLGTSMGVAAQGITAFSFTYLVCAPLFAVLLARRPAREILVAALAIFALGNVLTLLSTNLAMYLASRLIAGCGAGMYLPIAVAEAAELVDPKALGKALGLIWGANSAGAVIGVPAGLWLAARLGWHATIALVLILGILTLVGIAIGQPDRQVPAPSLADQLRFLVDRRVLSIVGVTCLTATASLGLYDFVAPLQSGAANSADAALTVWNVGGLIGTTAIGFVEDHIGNPRAVMAAILLTLLVTLLILPSTHATPVLGLLPFLVWGALGWATMTPQQMSLIQIEPGREATVVALNSSAVGLGSVFGPALGGLALAGGLGTRYLPYAAAAVLLTALAWQATQVPKAGRMSRPVVIVDPVDSGAELAPAFAARQIPAIAVRVDLATQGFAAQIQASHFRAVYEDGPELIDILRRYDPLAVIAGAESGVELADRLAAALTPHVANVPDLWRARRHKGVMQAALRSAGLPTIRTLTTGTPAEVTAWLEAQNLTAAALVVKPAASSGSDNVHHIPPGGDWRRPFDLILSSRTKLRGEANETVIVQERVVGTEFAVDTVSAAGDHVLAHLIRYTKTSAGGRETVFDHTEFLAFDPAEHAGMLAYVRHALDAVGIKWGAAHSEVMLTPDGPRLIEVGARTCGGPVLGFSRIATGSSQLERVVEAYVDGKIQSQTYDFKKTVVPVCLIAPVSGILRNVEVLESFRDLPTYLRTHMWLGNGDQVQQTVDWETVLGVVALAGDRDAVFADYKRVREVESRLRIEPSDQVD